MGDGTYGGMISDIKDDLKRPDLSAQIGQAIKDAISEFETKRFYFTEERATRPTIAQKEWYSLPGDFQDVTGITLIDADGRRKQLVPKSFNWIEQRKTSNTYYSTPTYFCFFQQQIRLYPPPDTAYTMELVYSKSLEDVVEVTTASRWFTDGEVLIKRRAEALVCSTVIQGPEAMQQADVFDNIAQAALSNLIAETARRSNTGRIEPTK